LIRERKSSLAWAKRLRLIKMGEEAKRKGESGVNKREITRHQMTRKFQEHRRPTKHTSEYTLERKKTH